MLYVLMQHGGSEYVRPDVQMWPAQTKPKAVNRVNEVANRLPEPPKKHLWPTGREAAERTCASNPSVLDMHCPFSVSLFPGQGHVCSSPDTSVQMISNAMAIIDNVHEPDALQSGLVNSNCLIQQLPNSVQDHDAAAKLE